MQEMKKQARAMRCEIIKMLEKSASGHPGGSLSAADIVAALYFGKMNIDPANPRDPKRDRFVLCKGHAAPALYAALALRGFFPVEELDTLRKIDSHLQGHPDMNKLPGVDMSTGSLGQGLSAAAGMALAGKCDNADYYVYALLGDGEQEEGQVWEAAMFAAHYQLGKLIAFTDNNHLQIDGRITDVMSPEPLDKKWEAFGWQVLKIDGHDMQAICDAIEAGTACEDKPTMIICETVKGKGVSFMENQVGWHGTAPKKEQAEQALSELEVAE
ncbi:MAG: transketolase [Firmicutes bacterium]|nr:transketolase [Bacillota bacterium]